MTEKKIEQQISWFCSKGEVETFEKLDYACVYALGPEKGRPIRIGWARRPLSRINALQEAHWQALRLHEMVWLPGQQMAQRMDIEIQRILTDGGRNIRGSWYDIPIDMIQLCVKVASDNLRYNTWSHEDMIKQVREMHQNNISRSVRSLGRVT